MEPPRRHWLFWCMLCLLLAGCRAAPGAARAATVTPAGAPVTQPGIGNEPGPVSPLSLLPSPVAVALPTVTPVPTETPWPTPTPWIAPTPHATATPWPTPVPLTGTVHLLYVEHLVAGFYFDEVQYKQFTMVDNRPVGDAGSTPVTRPMGYDEFALSPNGRYLVAVAYMEGGNIPGIIDLTTWEQWGVVGPRTFEGWHPNSREILGQVEGAELFVSFFDIAVHKDPETCPYTLGRIVAAQKPGGYGSAAISPNGQWLAYSVGGQVMIANEDGSEARPLGASGYALVWSPDSRYLLYTGSPAVIPEARGYFWANHQVGDAWPPHKVGKPRVPDYFWAYDWVEARHVRLATPLVGGEFGRPVWSPRGHTFAAGARVSPERCAELAGHPLPCREDILGVGGLYVEDMDTGEVILVAGNGSQPSWSPDGEALAFSAFNPAGQRDIWVWLRATGELYRLTDTPLADSAPVWWVEPDQW